MENVGSFDLASIMLRTEANIFLDQSEALASGRGGDPQWPVDISWVDGVG